MDFDEYYKSIIPTKKSILEAVDEYTLYCFYTGLDDLVLGRAYNAPYYRVDMIPSFSVFESRSPDVEYMWKDHSTGESGTIFKLIEKIEQLNTLNDVLARINDDFGLGFYSEGQERREKVQLYTRPEQNDIKIRIVEQPFNTPGKAFWEQFDIGEPLLKEYYTTQVKYFWTFDQQKAPLEAADPTFAYRVGEYYQLYSPYAPKQYKFRNDLPENYFFGYLQLPKRGKRLIIDKSSKDVIFCKRLGYDAVSGKSETTEIPESKVLEFKDRFDEVYLMLDNDKAGRQQTDKYMAKYPWLKPRFLTEAKDKTDLCKLVGFNNAKKTISQLISE